MGLTTIPNQEVYNEQLFLKENYITTVTSFP